MNAAGLLFAQWISLMVIYWLMRQRKKAFRQHQQLGRELERWQNCAERNVTAAKELENIKKRLRDKMFKDGLAPVNQIPAIELVSKLIVDNKDYETSFNIFYNALYQSPSFAKRELS